jgi:hypothetical protein
MTELALTEGDVQIEPLIDHWYVWTYLIPPATSSRNLTGRYMRIMESYIAAPTVHAKAVKNLKMLGGAFIDYDGQRVDEVRDLLAWTQRERVYLLTLSKDLEQLDQMLQSSATGESTGVALRRGSRVAARLRRAGLRPERPSQLSPDRAAPVFAVLTTGRSGRV